MMMVGQVWVYTRGHYPLPVIVEEDTGYSVSIRYLLPVTGRPNRVRTMGKNQFAAQFERLA